MPSPAWIVAGEVRMAGKNLHVVPALDGGWSVRKSGTSRASKIFDTQDDAMRYGQTLAAKESSDLYVHKANGAVTAHESYKK
jgi:hypothetical protein